MRRGVAQVAELTLTSQLKCRPLRMSPLVTSGTFNASMANVFVTHCRHTEHAHKRGAADSASSAIAPATHDRTGRSIGSALPSL